jgi:glycosyltransferase involved in cell wall biosynthesis
MKITVLFNGVHPSPTPMSKRLSLYVRGLKEAGVDAELVTTFRETKGVVSAYLLPYFIPYLIIREHHTTLKRSDVVVVDGFNWWTYLWLGAMYGRKRKLVFELNEKPGSVYTTRILQFKPIKWAGLHLTRISMMVFDGFIAISEPLREYISHQKKTSAKTVILPIIIDNNEPYTELKNEIPPHPYIIHTGAISQQKDGIVDVFEAFALVNKQEGNTLHFYLAGSKAAPPGVWEGINKVINDHGLKDNVHFLGLVFGDRLKTLQKNCSFLVLPKPDNEQNRNNFPTKLGEYLAFSRPVITTAVGDMALHLKDGFNAILVTPGNTEQISKAMLRLMQDRELADRLGQQGRETSISEFDYKILGKKLAAFLSQL